MWLALILACAPVSDPPAPVTVLPGAACPDTADTSRLGSLPRTVVVVVMDTTRRDFLGVNHPGWDITPRVDALAADGTRYDHVQATRGLTAVALSSVQTGAYPRTHGVRSNSGDVVGPETPTLQERFHDAGFRTYGFSANMCQLLDVGMDEVLCTSIAKDESRPQDEADAELVPAFFAALDARPAEEPAYLWLHLVEPHDPYVANPTWYAEFHPEPYTGPLDPPTSDTLRRVSDGEIPFTDADAAFLDAVYASQIRNTDDTVADLLAGLESRGRLDDAVVLFTMDHGEELADRTGYFYHGCSPYQTVLDVSAILWGPGRVPAGEVLAERVSATDLAPTLLELVGLPTDGPGEGRSLLPETLACEEPARDVFFERGQETAGIVSGPWKYVLDPRAAYGDCKDYSDADPYPGDPSALYDLETDPGEETNLVTDNPSIAEHLRQSLCGWITQAPWIADETVHNALILTCTPD